MCSATYVERSNGTVPYLERAKFRDLHVLQATDGDMTMEIISMETLVRQ